MICLSRDDYVKKLYFVTIEIKFSRHEIYLFSIVKLHISLIRNYNFIMFIMSDFVKNQGLINENIPIKMCTFLPRAETQAFGVTNTRQH